MRRRGREGTEIYDRTVRGAGEEEWRRRCMAMDIKGIRKEGDSGGNGRMIGGGSEGRVVGRETSDMRGHVVVMMGMWGGRGMVWRRMEAYGCMDICFSWCGGGWWEGEWDEARRQGEGLVGGIRDGR